MTHNLFNSAKLKHYTKALLLAAFSLFVFFTVKANPLTIDTLSTIKTLPGEIIPANPTDISPLLIGESIPTVNLTDFNGKPFNLNEEVAKKPTVLIFYRGGWCPFCNRELSGIQTIEGSLRAMGYQIVAISTDSPENLSKTMGKDQLTYTLLSDSELSVSKAFGLAYVAPKAYEKLLVNSSNGKNIDKLLPVPSVFILDTKGTIQFEYINPDYKQRINPDLLQAVAGALKKESK
ncbi:peroxiredoxin-like family protein [Mucilaginibacter sp.]|uniref:peroxiredoxin-like family protein n=1 Tax=Mucilaginibacter sp. TaxID=1882438 RepID=UPI003B00D331